MDRRVFMIGKNGGSSAHCHSKEEGGKDQFLSTKCSVTCRDTGEEQFSIRSVFSLF